MNDFNICLKVYHFFLNIKRDIFVQNIKVKKNVFYFLLLSPSCDHEIKYMYTIT